MRRRVATVPNRPAALLILALVIGTFAWTSHRRAPRATAAPANTVAPATSTTTTAPPTTTVAATTTAAPAARATNPAPAAVCTTPAVPAGAAPTTLATPNSPIVAYSATPGGPTKGSVASRWGGSSTRPVTDQQNGWVQIRVASRPNGSTGWVASKDVTLTTTDFRVVISTCQRSLTVFQGANPVYSAPVGVGRPQWPTPPGASFIDARLAMPQRELSTYGPTVFVLGSHSNVFTDFGGGDGTVAIHAYPSDPASTRGVASSHGCIRVSPATINFLTGVPVGTPVDVIT